MRRSLAAVLLLVQPLYVIVELLVARASSAPYSLRDNTISDLAAVSCTQIPYPAGPVPVCSPGHPWLNGAFIAFGLALVVGALLLPRAWRPGRLGSVAVGCWVASGLSSIATGLVPLDVDLELHTLGVASGLPRPAGRARPARARAARIWPGSMGRRRRGGQCRRHGRTLRRDDGGHVARGVRATRPVAGLPVARRVRSRRPAGGTTGHYSPADPLVRMTSRCVARVIAT